MLREYISVYLQIKGWYLFIKNIEIFGCSTCTVVYCTYSTWNSLSKLPLLSYSTDEHVLLIPEPSYIMWCFLNVFLKEYRAEIVSLTQQGRVEGLAPEMNPAIAKPSSFIETDQHLTSTDLAYSRVRCLAMMQNIEEGKINIYAILRTSSDYTVVYRL